MPPLRGHRASHDGSPMRPPVLTIVIPTANRPQLLPRAIESALQSAPGEDVEVIVVPNGPDRSWIAVKDAMGSCEAVRWEPIPTPHANAARNHGLRISRGEYIRFLDDDDYLISEGASLQLDAIRETGADLCSGLVDNVDVKGLNLGTATHPDTDDFVVAATSDSGFRLPVGNLFRRNSICDVRWDESVNRGQDHVWMLDLAAAREWTWVHTAHHVGAWFQHDQHRTSTVRISRDMPTKQIEALYRLHHQLSMQNRLTPERALAISQALWHFVHWRFPFAPTFWNQVAKRAQEISPGSHPDHSFFHGRYVAKLDPLLLEWAILPIRRITTFYRDLRSDMFGWDYRRRL